MLVALGTPSVASQRIIFGEFQPDQPAHLNEGVVLADGVYPIKNGYAPVKSFSAAANGDLPSRCYGAGAYRNNGQTYAFSATATNIYRYTLGGYASLISGLNNSLGVRFCSYSSLMLATNGADGIKKFNPTAPTTMTALGGTPPIARYIAVVGGFTILGYVSNISRRVAWSDQGNPENWTAGGASEAGSFDMAAGGDITGIVGGEYGLIFQEDRIVRMDYTASDTIWQFNEIATDVGCVIPGTISTWGKMTFFRSTRGFMVCDGASVTPIGSEKVDRWFSGKADRSYSDQVSSVIDPTNSLYLVTVPSAFPFNLLLLYNYTLGRWSTASLAIEYMAPGYAQATSLEDLDAIYGDLDHVTAPLDSPIFRGGAPLMLVYDDQHRLGALNGLPLPATIIDAKREPIQGRKSRIRSVRPLTDAASTTLTVSGANSLSDTMVPTTYTGRKGNGVMPVRESWNMVQMAQAIPSQTWTYAQGLDMEYELGGRA